MLGLRTAIYKVTELKEATEWYTTLFKTKPYFKEAFYVGFNIQGYELGLSPQEKKPKEKAESVFCYWGVTDIQKEFKRAIELGGRTHEKPTNVGGELMVCTFYDPWDNLIGFIYNPYFKLPD